MSAKSFACGADGCRLDPQPPGTGNDGIMRYPRYSECMQSCGPTTATPVPSRTPMPTAPTPMPSRPGVAPPYQPGHVVSYACSNDCLPVSGIWPDQKTRFSTRRSCMRECGRTPATVEPGWGTGVVEGDQDILQIALIGNIDRHVLNYM